MNINRGNLFDHMVSMASRSQQPARLRVKTFGANSPQAKLNIAMGDVVTTIIRTRDGPDDRGDARHQYAAPYSRKYMLQGTKGMIQKYPTPQIYLDDKSPEHQWEDIEKYAKEWEHPLWRNLSQRAKGAGHGGMDYIEDYRLIECLSRASRWTRTSMMRRR